MGVLLAEGGWMQVMEIECNPGIPEHPGDLGRKWHLEMEPLLLPCSNRLHLDTVLCDCPLSPATTILESSAVSPLQKNQSSWAYWLFTSPHREVGRVARPSPVYAHLICSLSLPPAVCNAALIADGPREFLAYLGWGGLVAGGSHSTTM